MMKCGFTTSHQKVNNKIKLGVKVANLRQKKRKFPFLAAVFCDVRGILLIRSVPKMLKAIIITSAIYCEVSKDLRTTLCKKRPGFTCTIRRCLISPRQRKTSLCLFDLITPAEIHVADFGASAIFFGLLSVRFSFISKHVADRRFNTVAELQKEIA